MRLDQQKKKGLKAFSQSEVHFVYVYVRKIFIKYINEVNSAFCKAHTVMFTKKIFLFYNNI